MVKKNYEKKKFNKSLTKTLKISKQSRGLKILMNFIRILGRNFQKLSKHSIPFFLFMYHRGFRGSVGCGYICGYIFINNVSG